MEWKESFLGEIPSFDYTISFKMEVLGFLITAILLFGPFVAPRNTQFSLVPEIVADIKYQGGKKDV